jgi:hypothetical protein
MKHKVISLILIGFLVISCKTQSTINNPKYFPDFSNFIDYSSEKNWAVLPGKYPENMKKYTIQNPQDSIDVFYVYPTLIVSNKDKRWNVTVEDSIQRNKVLNSAVHFQASAWASSGNLYVPYYRQAHLRSYSNLKNGGTTALLLAYADVKAAFEYYLKHYNHGNGIILAGHSQGSTHIRALLEDYFDKKPLQNQLVAAYIPGIGIDKNQFGTVPFMDKPDQIGGFVTWNTFKKKFDKKQYKWYKGKAVINPVTWDKTPIAQRKLHKGFLYSNGEMYRNSFETHISDGVIWISTPHFPYRYLTFLMPNYHTGDVNLFWEDIRENSLLRIQSYQTKKKNSYFAKVENAN